MLNVCNYSRIEFPMYRGAEDVAQAVISYLKKDGFMPACRIKEDLQYLSSASARFFDLGNHMSLSLDTFFEDSLHYAVFDYWVGDYVVDGMFDIDELENMHLIREGRN